MKTADRNMKDALQCLLLEVDESIVDSLKVKYALTRYERNNEIKQLIDEMLDWDDSLDTRTLYYRGYKKALTELKSKI